MATAEQLLMQSLNLPSCLSDRILCRVTPPDYVRRREEEQLQQHQNPNPSLVSCDGDGDERGSFVLYLPTVILRKKHNPAFALACNLANHYGVPLLVLVTVLDDQHLSRQPLSPISMTSRRLAFTMEALQESCCADWESHGAGVAIRVHGPRCRTPHHLSLAHVATAVVSDEPFVEPYREYVRNISKTCQACSVPFWTVDGSTSVPPNSKLVRKSISSGSSCSYSIGDVSFAGAPSKAWRWEKQTESVRKHHVYGAYRDRALDAPELNRKLPPNFFLTKNVVPAEGENMSRSLDEDNVASNNINIVKDDGNDNRNDNPWLESILDLIPSKWKDHEVPSPGQRPWSVNELCELPDCKAWALAWKGADPSVPPCKQTHGSAKCAKSRWKSFLTLGGLKNYAKKRNGITNPHSVSRISCYLNLGILSIFDVLHDIWEAQSSQKGYSTGCRKYLEEVGKWREGSYVHAFANPNYHTSEILPLWANKHLESVRNSSKSKSGYDYKELERAATRDETWNAMQEYLIDTGELHNNARMTWGKTVVHWQASMVTTEESLWQLCCLNDRFALDGLSPPSYGGVLWCYGWQDKPSKGNQVSEKWAQRYRTGPRGFQQAKEQLLEREIPSLSSSVNLFRNSSPTHSATGKRNGRNDDDGTSPRTTSSPEAKKARRHDNTGKADSKSILSYFSPAAKGVIG